MQTLVELEGTKWSGSAELWLDPLGDTVVRSSCTLSVQSQALRYTWSHECIVHEGEIALTDGGASFTDTWHQPTPMICRYLADRRSLLRVEGVYGSQSDWGWRINLSFRVPTDELVLQMTNVAPWGEEARAVRMTCRCVNASSEAA
ncbi:MAG: hypothetical protein ACR2PG_04160 [Hyphomicrobiaceae bacterium]